MRNKLLIPALAPLYAALEPVTLALLRVASGVALAVHGSSKIVDPMGNIGLVESLGFRPGVLFSPLLALTEFVGGTLLALGLLTRPAAAATTVVLLVTVWFHWITLGEGYMGAEKSILWASICLVFVARGGREFALDRRLGPGSLVAATLAGVQKCPQASHMRPVRSCLRAATRRLKNHSGARGNG